MERARDSTPSPACPPTPPTLAIIESNEITVARCSVGMTSWR